MPRLDTATGRHSGCAATTARRARGATASSSGESRLAAWRLRARGLAPGDRLLTWSPSCPELPAAYFGAMRAGLIIVPLDLRMSPDVDPADRRAVRGTPARHRHRPRRARPGGCRPGHAPDHRRRGAVGRARRFLPVRLGDPAGGLAVAAARGHVPPHLHLGHDRHAEGRDARPRQRPRRRRLVPAGDPADGPPHRLAPAAVAPLRAVGRAHVRPQPRGRHPVRPEPQPAGHLRGDPRPPDDVDGRRAPGPRPVLERHRARGREAGSDRDVRPPSAPRPTAADGRPTGHLPPGSRPVRRRAAPHGLGRRLPAAGGPAGLGGPRRPRHPGLRRDRDGLRNGDHPGGPRSRNGRSATARRRDAAGRGRRGPVPRPIGHERLLAGSRRHGSAAFTADGWYQDGRPRPPRPAAAVSSCRGASGT